MGTAMAKSRDRGLAKVPSVDAMTHVGGDGHFGSCHQSRGHRTFHDPAIVHLQFMNQAQQP